MYTCLERRGDHTFKASDFVFGTASDVLLKPSEKEFFVKNLLVQIHFIIEMMSCTGLAPWDLNPLFQVALYLSS